MRDLLVRGRLQRRYLVLVTADAAQARALTTKIQGVETLSAISDATVVQSDPEGSVERASSTSRRCAGARVQGWRTAPSGACSESGSPTS